MVFVGSWISGCFIIVTNAWMQHPVAYTILPSGTFEITSFMGLLLNPWAMLEYAHNMCASVITAAFVMAAVGAFYLLEGRFFRVPAHLREDRSDCGLHLIILRS